MCVFWKQKTSYDILFLSVSNFSPTHAKWPGFVSFVLKNHQSTFSHICNSDWNYKKKKHSGTGECCGPWPWDVKKWLKTWNSRMYKEVQFMIYQIWFNINYVNIRIYIKYVICIQQVGGELDIGRIVCLTI